MVGMWNVAVAKEEMKIISKLAVPAVISSLSEFFILFANTAFVGHLGNNELAGISLANTWAFCTSWVTQGLSFGLDTFVTQAHGAGNYALAGDSLQRTFFCVFVFSLPVAACWFFTENVLLLVGIDPAVAALAGQYNIAQLPSLWPYLAYRIIVKYLQAQGTMIPPAIVGLIISVLNAVFDFVLIKGAFGWNGFGFIGVGYATVCTRVTYLIAMYICLKRSPNLELAWRGWSLDALKPALLIDYLKIAFPAALTISLEAWGFDIHTIFAGLLHSSAIISAHSIGFTLLFCSFLLPLGISIAVSTRVGNLMGAADLVSAKRSAYFGLVFGTVVMLMNCLVLLSTRTVVPKLFTDDPEVIRIASNILVFVSFVTIIDGIQAVSAGILRGVGRPTPGTVCNIVGHYAVGIPLAATLAFATYLSIYGLWAGLFCGLLVVAGMLVTFVVRIDWDKACKDAQQRTHKKLDHTKFTELDEFSIGDEDSDDSPHTIIAQVIDNDENRKLPPYKNEERKPAKAAGGEAAQSLLRDSSELEAEDNEGS